MDRYNPTNHTVHLITGGATAPRNPLENQHTACRAPQGAAGHRVVLHPQVRCSSLVTRAPGAR